MHNKTISQLQTELKNKKISSVELTQYYLKRIETLDKNYNSFITVCAEHALKQAKSADTDIAAGKINLLTGIPIAQKDIFCTAGIKTTCGSKILDNFIAPYESTVTQKFLAAGSVMLGKTNMDEFAMGSSNETSFYGPVKNPWNLACTPGGSSGGSAAAVAAGLAPAATGTDTGGSIRQPAALCNLTGLKPTYGRVSRYGMIAFTSSLDQAGPLAKTAEDAAILMNVISGYDAKDSTCVNRDVPDYTADLNKKIAGLTIGLPKEYFIAGLDPAVEKAVQTTITELKKLGCNFKEISLPHTELAASAYYVIAPAECSSNLARFDGVRYGYRCENPVNLIDLYERSRAEGFGSEVKRRILVGTYVLSAGYFDAYYRKAQRVRRLIRDDFVNALKEVDVILTPSTPTPAFKIGEKSENPLEMYKSDILTISINLVGIPGMSIPCGFENNLPVGMQILGNQLGEEILFKVGSLYQAVTEWHLAKPDIIQ